ncbi:MAG: hypothetical protein AAGA46_07230 [Cyanobacteria bacterium P01_F01_bin.13]
MPDYSFPEPNPPKGFNSAVRALIEVDQKPGFSAFSGPTQQPWRVPSRGYNQPPEINSLLRPLVFAEPLAPLRQRDEKALEEVFDDAQVEEIVTDICTRLRQLYPEPCWEDDPFEFLQGYL